MEHERTTIDLEKNKPIHQQTGDKKMGKVVMFTDFILVRHVLQTQDSKLLVNILLIILFFLIFCLQKCKQPIKRKLGERNTQGHKAEVCS